MQLLPRSSFSSPAINPWIVVFGCCVLVHLIWSVYTTSDAHSNCGVVLSVWMVTWSIAGGTGSYSLLLTFLCIKFQDTNSMSVPKGNLKKLHSLFKQESLKKAATSSKDKGKRIKKTSRKGKKQEQHRPLRGKDDNDKLKKSKHNFLPDISTTGVYSTISSADHSGFKNQLNPPFSTQHPYLLNAEHKDNLYVPHSSANTDGKRKSGRRGKNANESPESTSLFSSIGSSLLRGSVFMNQNEEEALRRKVLAKVDELDPLMCLPKVLCGYSSRRRHKSFKTTTTTTSTTHRPTINEAIIDEYLQLLGIIPPISKEKVEDDLEEADMYLKKQKKNKKVGKGKKKKKQESEEDNIEQEQSGSSSFESRESAQYGRYPHRKPYRRKFLFNRNRDSEENDIDEDDDNSEMNSDDDWVDDLLDDEHVKYVVKRKKMENLMAKSGSHSEENWWDPFEEPTVTMPYGYYPPDPTYDPLATDDFITDGGITGWFSNMFSNLMPRLSWSNKKEDDFAIKNDPFFSSFDGRSLTNRESRSIFSFNKLKQPSPSVTTPKQPVKKGKQLDLQRFFGVRVNSKQLDYTTGDDRDPAEKYRMAVEIGSRVTNPGQCDIIYNGCPLSYEEILVIINEPLRQKPVSKAKKPSRVRTTTTSPTFNKGDKSFAHNFITPPPPRQIVVPLHQQQQLPYQPPQPILLHQQQPQYHILHPQQNYQQQHPQMQMYNQQLQQQLHYMPQPLYQPGQLVNIDGTIGQLGKRKSKPHKTKIHHALPSGEVEINLNYQPENLGKSDLPQGNMDESNNNLNNAQEWETAEETQYPYSGAMSNSYEHNQQTDPFSHKVLTHTNYEFLPSKNGYKIRRKDSEMEKSAASKDVSVVSNTIKEGSSSSASTLSASSENNSNNMKVVSSPVPEQSTGIDLKKRTVRIPSLAPYTSKGKGKYQRKQLFKNTSSSAPPLRHSSSHHKPLPQQQQALQQGVRKRKGNGNNMKIMRKKYGKEKRKKRKGIQNDDNSSGNSSSNNGSSASSSASNEEFQYNKKGRRTKYRGEMQKVQRERLKKKKKRRKPHLHKQSSDSIEAEKSGEIEAPNAIYPIYGHPFPPPYAGYYHTLHPSTPTSPSFFSYFFGR